MVNSLAFSLLGVGQSLGQSWDNDFVVPFYGTMRFWLLSHKFELFLAIVIEVFRGSVFEVQEPFPAYPKDAGAACRLGLVVGVDVVWPPGHGDLIVSVDHPSVAVDVSGCLSCSGVHFRVGFLG